MVNVQLPFTAQVRRKDGNCCGFVRESLPAGG